MTEVTFGDTNQISNQLWTKAVFPMDKIQTFGSVDMVRVRIMFRLVVVQVRVSLREMNVSPQYPKYPKK